MATQEFTTACAKIWEADSPEDYFGLLTDSDDKLKAVGIIYRQTSAIIYPERNQSNETKATEAFVQLNALYGSACSKIRNDTYGQNPRPVVNSDLIIETRKGSYALDQTTATEGDISRIYFGEGSLQGQAKELIVAKVVNDPVDNDLMENEIKTLQLLYQLSDRSKHLPVLLDIFKTSANQKAVILKYLEDSFDLRAIRETKAYKNGLPQEHVVWILSRLLSVVGYVHSKGVIHGNIEPSHLMITPKNHNLTLLDWSYSVNNPKETNARFQVYNPDFSAPELKDKLPPIPSADLYSVGKCAIFMLGGNLSSNSIPSNTNAELTRFIKWLVMKSPVQRAQDAWEAYEFLEELRKNINGGKRFIEFKVAMSV